jgi:glycosyltransferase involved in cell wall biosynthesis
MRNKMKIVCLNTRFEIGGAQLDAILLARLFRDRGYDAEAWFLMRNGAMSDADIPIVVLAETVPQTIGAWVRLVISFLRKVKEREATIVIGFQPLANVFSTIAALICRVRSVATLRNPSESQSKLLAWIEALLSSTPLCSANIAISQSVVRSFAHYPARFKKKIGVVYNGLPPLPVVTEDVSACRALFGLPADAFLVGAIGRLDHQKNPEFLLSVLALLPGVHLVVGGVGPLESELKARAATEGLTPRVHFVGAVQGTDVPRLYRALDLFLFPTRYEGFGRVLLEAFTLNIPVVATKLDITEEVAADAAVLLPLDAHEWAAAVATLRDNSLERRRLVAKGQQRVQMFSLDAMVDGHLRYLAVQD